MEWRGGHSRKFGGTGLEGGSVIKPKAQTVIKVKLCAK